VTKESAEISSDIKSYFELSAVPGSFLVNGTAIGLSFVSIRFSQTLGLFVEALGSLDAKGPRSLPTLTFPMLSSHILLLSVRPDTPFAVDCSGTDCGSVFPTPQKVSRFNCSARYCGNGLDLSIDGTIERATTPTRNEQLSLPPGSFEIRANVPWAVLPYLFERTPPFFEKYRQTMKAPSPN
jgi:hypothetical protein